MITIEQLDVRFDVEGEGDEAAFARLFQKYIQRWSRLQQEEQSRQRFGKLERSLGDRRPDDLR